MLVLVATPIGHLDDISKRALDALKNADLVLVEDTRRSIKLLNHYSIKKPLISYHKFNEKKSLDTLIEDLKGGKNIALISDAGTPSINDPGRILVEKCLESGIEIDAIPGPCSIIQALVLSGYPTDRFQFVGFLPKNPQKILRQIFSYPGTTVAFESPERLLKTLEKVPEGKRVCVVREMTKTFQERIELEKDSLIEHFKKKPPKGECVLLFQGGSMIDESPLEEIVEMLQELHGLSLKEAIKMAASLKKVPKRTLYKKFHQS